MSRNWKWEYMKAIYARYHKANRKEKKRILDELCKVWGCHRKHAIRVLNGPLVTESRDRRRRGHRESIYSSRLISIIRAVWEASGYLWSKRLKAALPLWLPWIRLHFKATPKLERQIPAISPAQIDRRLKGVKRKLRKRIYGATKAGSAAFASNPYKD